MTNRVLVALLLAGVLAVPVLAQQDSSTTQNQPAATQSQPTTQSQPATDSQPATTQQGTQPAAQPANQSAAPADQSTGSSQSATGKPLQPPAREGFWGRVNPFARKKYVQRQTAPIRDRINELDELTNNNSKMIKDVDSRAQEGIRLASSKANEADQHAIDAGNRAQAAQQTATQATTRIQTVETVVSNIDQYQPATQTEIRFRPGQSVLSKKAKEALDELASNVGNMQHFIVTVEGGADSHVHSGQRPLYASDSFAKCVA